jgi:hypothetical protein
MTPPETAAKKQLRQATIESDTEGHENDTQLPVIVEQNTKHCQKSV